MILAAMEEALATRPGISSRIVSLSGTTSGEMSLGEQFYRSLASGSPAWSATREEFAPMPRGTVHASYVSLAFARPSASSRMRARPEQTRSDLPVR